MCIRDSGTAVPSYISVSRTLSSWNGHELKTTGNHPSSLGAALSRRFARIRLASHHQALPFSFSADPPASPQTTRERCFSHGWLDRVLLPNADTDTRYEHIASCCAAWAPSAWSSTLVAPFRPGSARGKGRSRAQWEASCRLAAVRPDLAFNRSPGTDEVLWANCHLAPPLIPASRQALATALLSARFERLSKCGTKASHPRSSPASRSLRISKPGCTRHRSV